jgi:ribosomal protein S18 acetylase RimI-like enzyme
MTGPKRIELRSLRAQDADTFHAMAMASWLDAYAHLLPPDIVADAPRMIASAMAARFDKFIVAFDGARALGYYSLGDSEEDRNYLWHLYVDPSQQRRGVGETLHAAALAELRARGCGDAKLDYVAGNEKAARFYARQGWVETGRDQSGGMNLVLMRRDL